MATSLFKTLVLISQHYITVLLNHWINIYACPCSLFCLASSKGAAISPERLYSLLSSCPDNILVLDCRLRSDYVSSHVDTKKYPQWLCVAEEAIKKGWVCLSDSMLIVQSLSLSLPPLLSLSLSFSPSPPSLSLFLSFPVSLCLSFFLSFPVSLCLSLSPVTSRHFWLPSRKNSGRRDGSDNGLCSLMPPLKPTAFLTQIRPTTVQSSSLSEMLWQR